MVIERLGAGSSLQRDHLAVLWQALPSSLLAVCWLALLSWHTWSSVYFTAETNGVQVQAQNDRNPAPRHMSGVRGCLGGS